ncbi:hypothetical protein J42TS3_41910 [Paenibacillus vini]|uniref:Uncharacterized protein n=1 Tax=Paenibacillus vini TaxID=1476024 RepID=A0ABQ4MGN8_9BACL|nr:hypothetical protein J42TS3_41910 [Paenibacillus vini]
MFIFLKGRTISVDGIRIEALSFPKGQAVLSRMKPVTKNIFTNVWNDAIMCFDETAFGEK